MNMRNLASVFVLSVGLVTASSVTGTQVAEDRPPREFRELQGTWRVDNKAGSGRIAGLPVAGQLVIATTPIEISVVKDGATPEVYSIDGSETVDGDVRRSFRLVADSVALTSRRTRPARGRTFTNIVTDAYAVSGDVLTVERQLSVLVQPPGSLATLSDSRNNRQTIVYRRNP